MSLINDALKKAQKQRADPSGESLPPMPGGGGSVGRRVQKRGEPMRAQTIFLLAGVTLTVLVLAVGGGFYFLRAGAKSPETVNAGTTLAPVAVIPIPAAPNPPPAPPPASVLPPAVVAPGNVASTKPTPAPAAAAVAVGKSPLANSSAAAAAMASSTTAPLIIAVVTPTPAPLVLAPTPTAAPAAPSAPAGPNAMVYSFLDTLHVGGIRSSGNESRVLMNEHVYRVGDVVDHLLGLKLTKVGADTLTFVDLTGAVYVKNF